MTEFSPHFHASACEPEIYAAWEAAGLFRLTPRAVRDLAAAASLHIGQALMRINEDLMISGSAWRARRLC